MKPKKSSAWLSFTAAVLGMVVSSMVAFAGEAAPQVEKATLKISGPMHVMCTSCQKEVRHQLEKVDGVKKVTFDMKKGTADVTYVAGKTTPDALAHAVAELNEFKASVISTRMN